MIRFLLAQKLDRELWALRDQWKAQGIKIDYIRFPAFYRFLRWDISNSAHDEKRGKRLVIASHLALMLVITPMAIYDITGWQTPWPLWWEWPFGAIFSLVVMVLHWEPYRQDAVWKFTLTVPAQMLIYLSAGIIGVVFLITEPSSESWPFALVIPLAVAGLCCYRLGRLYERDLLRGRH